MRLLAVLCCVMSFGLTVSRKSGGACGVGVSVRNYAVGPPVSCLEDPRPLRGEGCFTDDFNLDGQADTYVYRAQCAHGLIRNLDVAAARALKASPISTGRDTGARVAGPACRGVTGSGKIGNNRIAWD